MELLIKAAVISLFCTGLRMVTSKGMILYFLRKPYEWLEQQIKYINDRNEYINEGTNEHKENIKYLKLFNIASYILKPIIACVTCMASVWTIVIDWMYYNNLNKWTIVLIFMAACLNTVIFSIYEKLNQCRN